MTRKGHLDRTTISFLQQIGSALIWVVFLILYAHLIPVLRSVGTALLAGASIASIVIGLAAQSTLGNLVAGIAITIYRPFRLGDIVQVAAPAGTETGSVELITLGYTRLRTTDGRVVVVPNSLAASQVTINLGGTPPANRLSITIRVPRESDLSAVRSAGLAAATRVLGKDTAKDCLVTAFEANSAVLTLAAQLPSGMAVEGARAELLLELFRALAPGSAGIPEGQVAVFA
jgi:small-conductance mechanosensitive channel